MPQYSTDFSDYTIGSTPDDWVQRVGTRSLLVSADAQAGGGKVLTMSGAANSDLGLTWDAVDDDPERDDVEILIRFRNLDENSELRALARGSLDGTDRYGYVVGSRLDTTSGDAAKFVSGTYNDIRIVGAQTHTVYDRPLGTWINQKIQVSGTAIRLKAWVDGDAEPANWHIDEVDSSISSAGWVGLYSNRDGTVEVDFFGVGTGGDPAPTEVVSTDPAIALDQFEIAPGDTLTGTATNFGAEPSAVTLNDGSSPAYTPALTTAANGDDWDISATVENFAAQAKAAGEGNPIQGLIPGPITVTVE